MSDNLATNIPGLTKTGLQLGDICEASPVVWQGRLLVLVSRRWTGKPAPRDHYLELRDGDNQTLSTFGRGYNLASAFIWGDVLYAYAARHQDGWRDVSEFTTRDLVTWSGPRVVVAGNPDEELFNQSVCWDGSRFLLAYESNDPRWPAFTNKFAESQDLVTWQQIPDRLFAPDRYTACPCLRALDGYHYLLYLEHRRPDWRFETFLVRSRDLVDWEPSPLNPILAPAPDGGECINTSDPDLAEYGGKVLLYYSYGDQRTWSQLTRAEFPGALRDFFAACYPDCC